MASWNDPPVMGCVVAADRRHDWQWVTAEPRRGLLAWLARQVMRCAACGRAPSDPWAQPNPAEVAEGWADRAPTPEHPARPAGGAL
jgi:hypothetical protein